MKEKGKPVGNERFHNALARRPQATPPIWFMRQAGRYHKHYQELRAQHSFMDLCKIPELAAEVALGPIRDFDFDVAILFSDLLFPLEALGMGLSYDPSPQLGWHLNEDTIGRLHSVDEALPKLMFQQAAVQSTRERLAADKSLIGFVGGPWTLFAYAVEGEHKGSLVDSKGLLRLFEPFCETLVPLLEQNIELQLSGGAELVMLLDTAAGELDPFIYRSRVVPHLRQLIEKFPRQLGYYSKGGTAAHFQDPLFKQGSGLAGLGFDHRWEMNELLRQYNVGFVQGNLDQALLFLPADEFKMEAERYLMNVRALPVVERAGWVCGLGHGVLPKTPEENVRTFVRLVREVLK